MWYTTLINNTLTGIVEDIIDLDLSQVPNDIQRPLGKILERITSTQVVSYGTYDLLASKYELLCGKQGAAGIADPDLLSATIDAPAGFSTAGQQAYRCQQQQAIKSAAQRAGRRSGGSSSGNRSGRGPTPARTGAGNGAGKRGGKRGKPKDKGKGKTRLDE